MQPVKHDEKIRRKVVFLFFSGLLLMAFLAIGIGWISKDLWSFNLGWLHPAIGFAFVLGGINSGNLVGSHPIYPWSRHACAEGRHPKVGNPWSLRLYSQPNDFGCPI